MARIETLNLMNQKELSAMSPPYRYDVFISYASEDLKEIVMPLVTELKALGLKVWFAESSLLLGDIVSASINRALIESEYAILIVSKTYLEKTWPKEELDTLLYKQVNEKRKIILPIWHKVSVKDVEAKNAMLAKVKAVNSSDPNVAQKLFSIIHGSGVADLSSDTGLKENMPKLFRSVEQKEYLFTQANEQMLSVILTKIYLVTGGYRNVFVYDYPFSDLLCSNEEQRQRLWKSLEDLKRQKLVTSKALATFSITHQGIKKIENLLENSSRNDSDEADLNLMKSISEEQKQAIFDIQKLRYAILKKAYEMFKEGIETVNIHEIAQPLGIQKEDLNRIYFYLEDEGLIEFYALGGSFSITDKGKEFIENTTSNRIH